MTRPTDPEVASAAATDESAKSRLERLLDAPTEEPQPAPPPFESDKIADLRAAYARALDQNEEMERTLAQLDAARRAIFDLVQVKLPGVQISHLEPREGWWKACLRSTVTVSGFGGAVLLRGRLRIEAMVNNAGRLVLSGEASLDDVTLASRPPLASADDIEEHS